MNLIKSTRFSLSNIYLRWQTVQWDFVSDFITNNAIKKRLKLFGRTFWLISGAIVRAKNLFPFLLMA